MIVPVEPHEAPAIADFIERTIASSVDATELEKEAFVRNVRSNLETWQARPQGALHLKFVDGDGALAGVVMVKAYWNLCHLFVEPKHQGQGVGKALMQAAIAACRGRSPRQCLRLNASRNAVGFYRHMGFRLAIDAPPAFAGVQYEFPLDEEAP
jgi:GNAT superfamily N-acetyltransferase